MKKQNLIKMLIFTSFLTLVSLSCRKDSQIRNDNTIESAKDWYVKLSSNSKTSLKSSKQNEEKVTTKYKWDKAKSFTFSDGKNVIGVPVNLIMGDKDDAPGSYMLLIYKTDNEYSSAIIFNQKDGYYQDSKSTSDIEAAFIINQKSKVSKSLSKDTQAYSTASKDKKMRLEVEPVCIDWYLITTITWPDGQINVYEDYLYSTCYPTGGGGGGCACVLEPETFIPDFGVTVSTDDGGSGETTTIINGDSFVYKRVSWKFQEGGGWWGKSTEKLWVKYENGVKTWYAIDHVEHAKVGGPLYANVSFPSFAMTPHVVPGSDGNAFVDLRFKVRITPIGLGDFDSDYLYSYATWNINFEKIQ